MRKVFSVMATLAIVFLFSSCGSVKNLIYFQGIDTLDLSPSRFLYDARVMPKDILAISVSTRDPEAAKPFYLNLQQQANNNYAYNQGLNMYGYLVDNNGDINFPVIGFIHVEGLTARECEALIRDKIMPYMSKTENPIVTVRMSSFHVTIIGEAGPTVVSVPSESMNIIEALARAGDISVYGKRDNILLIRQDKFGQKHQYRIDITKADVLNSPFYYLQQNDIIYVEPNKTKLANTTMRSYVGVWLGSASTLLSIATLIWAIKR
jgi:polysaccharide export outer membrane protein